MASTIRPSRRHVLLYGVDGVQLERLEALLPSYLPNAGFGALSLYPAFTGGHTGTHSQQDTMSGPGWTSILTGVWARKHGVDRNDERARASSDYPSIIDRIRQHTLATANSEEGIVHLYSLAGWKILNANMNFTEGRVPYTNSPLSAGPFPTDQRTVMVEITAETADDRANTARVLEILDSQEISHNPKFIFVQVDDIDEAGHARCFGKFYDSCVRAADADLARILGAIERRVERQRLHHSIEENWMVLVTTDHGRDIIGWNHGYQTQSEKRAFLGFWFAGSEAERMKTHMKAALEIRRTFSDKIVALPLHTMYRDSLPLTCISPTVLAFLRVPVSPIWKLEGVPLWLEKEEGEIEVPLLHDAIAMGDALYWSLRTDATAEQEPEPPTVTVSQYAKDGRLLNRDEGVEYTKGELELKVDEGSHGDGRNPMPIDVRIEGPGASTLWTQYVPRDSRWWASFCGIM